MEGRAFAAGRVAASDGEVGFAAQGGWTQLRASAPAACGTQPAECPHRRGHLSPPALPPPPWLQWLHDAHQPVGGAVHGQRPAHRRQAAQPRGGGPRAGRERRMRALCVGRRAWAGLHGVGRPCCVLPRFDSAHVILGAPSHTYKSLPHSTPRTGHVARRLRPVEQPDGAGAEAGVRGAQAVHQGAQGRAG